MNQPWPRTMNWPVNALLLTPEKHSAAYSSRTE